MTAFVVGEKVRVIGKGIGIVKEIIFFSSLPLIPLYVILVNEKETKHFDWQLKKAVSVEEEKNFLKLFE